MVNALYVYKEKTPESEYNKPLISETIRTLIILLAPFIPHAASEMWEIIGGGSISDAAWVKAEAEAMVVNEIEVVVQINGKIRGKLMISPDSSPKEMEEAALSDSSINALVDGKNIVKVICVPKKLINIVVK